MKGVIPDSARIQHIFECIEEIEVALNGYTYETFIENHILRIAVVKWLEIIGEAGRFISEDTKDKYKNVEWKKLIGLRNHVVHEYFGINYNVVWESATISIKGLKAELETINLDLN